MGGDTATVAVPPSGMASVAVPPSGTDYVASMAESVAVPSSGMTSVAVPPSGMGGRRGHASPLLDTAPAEGQLA